MKYFICLLLLSLCACGSGEVLVTIETVDLPYLQSICNDPSRCEGYAVWNHNLPQKTCTMFLLPMSEYRSEYDYYYARGHEDRHCFEGYFH